MDILTRSEPEFHARNAFRLDLYPHLALPLSLGGWTFRPEVAVRETFYSKSETAALAASPASISPTLEGDGLNRADFEAGVDIRPPAVQRDFSARGWKRCSAAMCGTRIEPDIHYQYVTGINNFNSVLRFDEIDVAQQHQ